MEEEAKDFQILAKLQVRAEKVPLYTSDVTNAEPYFLSHLSEVI